MAGQFSYGECRLRECRSEEAASLLALWRKAGATVGVTDTVEDIQQVISADAAIVLVAEQEERLVGCVIGAFDGWRGNIYRLAVDPEYQRLGIARRLVDEVEARLAQRGVKRMTAMVEIDRPWAARFWAAQGFERDDTAVRYVRNL